MVASKSKQIELHMPTRGGRRAGAGRKRASVRSTVPHGRRPRFVAAHPLQVTLRVCEGVPSLREPVAFGVVLGVLRAMRELAGFRVVHYSVLSNHLHLIVEADGREAFEAGMRGLSTRLALRLNRVFERRGRLIEHRHHARALTTPRAVHASLQYVLCNLRKHAAQAGQSFARTWIDPRSSGSAFDGWHGVDAQASVADVGVSTAHTWLLRVGWRKWGRIASDTVPGGIRFDSAIVGSPRVTAALARRMIPEERGDGAAQAPSADRRAARGGDRRARGGDLERDADASDTSRARRRCRTRVDTRGDEATRAEG